MTGKYGINKVNKQMHAKYQKLCNYKIGFNFKTDAGFLNYLKNMEFQIDPIQK